MSFEEYAAFDLEAAGLGKENQITAVGYAKHEKGRNHGQTYTLENYTEPQLIRKLVEKLEASQGPIFSYNGIEYDLWLLKARCDSHMELDDLKQRIQSLEDRHVDLMKIDLRVNGDRQGLETYAEQHGITHTVDCDGKEAVKLYQKARWDDLEEYLKMDVRVTFELSAQVMQKRDQLIEYQYSPVAST